MLVVLSQLPPEITFIPTSPEIFASLPETANVIFAHKWRNENLPTFNKEPLPKHDGYTGTFPGIYADNLTGVGFAFPEMYKDGEGHEEHRVGFNFVFYQHLNRIMRRIRKEENSNQPSFAQ